MNLPLENAALRQLENAVNHALTLDPGTRNALAELAGKTLGIEITFPPLSLVLGFQPTGAISLTSGNDDTPCTTEPDVKLSGNPVALALLLARAGDTHSFARSGVNVKGDQDILRVLTHIVGKLDIDWEHALAGVIGDTPAHLAGRAVRSAGNWYKSAANRSSSGLGEFMREESGITVSGREADNWFTGVGNLAADTDRLAARINRLTVLLDRSDVSKGNC